MSNTTPGINSVNKVQAQTAGKSTIVKKDDALNFNDLFSSAMGNAAPQARLSNIENQLRNALLKQEKDKKPAADTNPGAEAAQAAVWAQRNWMQNTPMEQSAATPASRPVEASRGPKETQSSGNDEAGKTEQSQPVKEYPASESAGEAPVENTASASPNESVASQKTDAAPGNPSTPGTTVLNNEETVATALTTVVPSGETTNQVQQQALPAELAGISVAQVQASDMNRADKAELKSPGDTVPDNTGSLGTEPSSSGNNAVNNNGLRATNPVAAQIAPQVAQQMQIAENTEADGEGLQIGQKLMASGTLQAAGTPNGIAAGTNGLNGTLGASQQSLIKTPVNQPGFAKELGQTVQWAIGKNLSTVDIRVNPETFGPMNMRLVQKGQQLQLVIRTQDEASANLLTQALGGLKEVMAQNGLQLGQVQIQHGNMPEQRNAGTNAQADQNPGQGGRQGNRNQAPDASNSSNDPLAGPAPATAATAKGKLDLFA